jgi:hypothetical protein
LLQRFAEEGHVEKVACRALAAVAADQPGGMAGFLAVRPSQRGRHARITLDDAFETQAVFDASAQFFQLAAQDAFDTPLRNHQRYRIRHGRCRLGCCMHGLVAVMPLLVIQAHRHVVAAVGQHIVDHAQVMENFQAARLGPFAARTLEGTVGAVDQAKRYGTARQFNGQGHPGRTGTDDQDLCLFLHDFFIL